MYGLAVIEHTKGWIMAGEVACLVLSGLAVLALLIYMIARLTRAFEKKATSPEDQNVEALDERGLAN